MYVIALIIIIENQILVSFVYKMMVRLFTAAKLLLSTDLSRLHRRIPCICLEKRYIPIFDQRCSNGLNKMTNLHCCHCLGRDGQVALSSLFSIKLTLAVHIQCLTKTQFKYLKHFITIKLSEKTDLLGIVDKKLSSRLMDLVQ